MEWRVKNTFVHVAEEEEPEADAGWSGTRLTRSRSDSSLPPLMRGKIIPEPRDRRARLPLDETATTAMLDIGKRMSLQELVALLDEKGLNCAYDFVYIPGGFQRKGSKSVGYAVVNFVAAKDLQRARSVLTLGFSAFRLQGLEALIARYQGSAMMHSRSVEDKFKPALFQEGRRTTFPVSAASGKGGGQQAHRLPGQSWIRNVQCF